MYPSIPCTHLTFKVLRISSTRSLLVANRSIEYLSEKGGEKMPESLRVELNKRKDAKERSFSFTAIVSSERILIRWGKVDLRKLLEMIMASGHKFLLVGEP